MKRLHVIRSVDPSGGGPIEALKQLAHLSLSDGHEVEVASLDDPTAPFVNCFPLRLHPLGVGNAKYGFSPVLMPWLEQNAARYDVVVVNGIWQYHSFAAWKALRKSTTPYVVYTHGMLDPWFKKNYPLKHLKKWTYWPWADYRVLRDAAAVLFTSEEERILARKSFWLYKAREMVVQYGTARPPVCNTSNHQDGLARSAEIRGKRIVLFIGRVHPKKGCDLILRAFAMHLAGKSEWHLVMAGPDQVGLAPILQRLANQLGIERQVTWAGMTQGSEKWSLMHSAEVFFLPSHQENFGIAVAEALGCGVPVLISNKVNIWREIEADGAGLVAPDTLDGATALLQRWVTLPDHLKIEMRHRARKCFEERFEIHRASSSLLSVLSRIAEEGKRANATN